MTMQVMQLEQKNQGDVILKNYDRENERVLEQLPDGDFDVVADNVIAGTIHKHRVKKGEVRRYKNNALYVVANENTTVEHDNTELNRHDSVSLASSRYWFVDRRQTLDALGKQRVVED